MKQRRSAPPATPAPADASSLEQLTADPENRRTHPARNLEAIASALRDVGAARSIVIDEAGRILAGNGVATAARSIGLSKVRIIETAGDEVIAVRRRGLTDEQKRALAIYDNRTGELAEWNLEQLTKDRDAGVAFGPLWTPDEQAALFAPAPAIGRTGNTDADDIPAARPTTITRGDLFALGDHRLLVGDSTHAADVARLLEDVTLDALVTDPPYCSGGFQEAGRKAGSIGTRGTIKIANDMLSSRGYAALIKSILHGWPSGLTCLFTDWRMWVNLFDATESCGFGVRAMVVWDKGTPGMGVGWRSQHELIMVASRVAQPFDPKKAQGNVLQCKRTGNVYHPTEKPVDLIARVLEVSDMARTVGEPFTGSGTTLIACERIGGRRCFAMELDPTFAQVTIDRWEAFTGRTAEKIGAGVEAARRQKDTHARAETQTNRAPRARGQRVAPAAAGRRT
jgi:DNA modification methylase